MSEKAQSRAAEAVPIPRRMTAAVWIIAALAFLFFQWGTWRQYADGNMRGDAVQVYNTMLSRFADGGGMIHYASGNHFFKYHFFPALYLLGCLYKIYDSLWTFLTPLNVALALAVVPLGLLAWRRTRSIPVSVGICLVYTLSSMTASMRLAVHSESLIIPGWMLLFYGVETRRIRWIICGSLLTTIIKEDSGFWLAIYFSWAVVFKKIDWKTGVVAAFASVFMLFFSRAVIAAVPTTGIPDEVGDFWLRRFGGAAETPAQLVTWLLTHPALLLQRAVFNNVWPYIFLSSGIICILGWRELLLLIPPGLLILSASMEEFHHGLYYYLYPFIPGSFLALVAGSEFLLKRFRGNLKAERGQAFALVVIAIAQLAIPTRVNDWMQIPVPLSLAERVRVEAARDMVQRNVPRDSKLLAATHYNLCQWIPKGRQMLFLRDEDIAKADLILLDTRMISADLGRDKYEYLLWRLLFNPESQWQVTEEIDDLVVMRKK